ncbi:MAG: tetratricopeptide repeat protein [Methanococcaceae archaeon]
MKNNITAAVKKKEEKKESSAEQHQPSKLFDKNEITYLFLIILGGLILRLVYVLETEGTPFFTNLFSDSKIYSEWAHSILNKGAIGTGAFFMAPFYPYFLALVYAIFGESVTAVRILQVLVSSANILIIYLIARNLINRQAAYLSAGIAAFYKVFIFYSGAILSETLQTFFTSLFILSLTYSYRNEKEKHWLYSGILLGIIAIFRGNVLLFAPAAAVWLLYKAGRGVNKNFAYKALLFFFIGTAIPILPVTIRNYAVSGDFVVLTSNGGINFYLGNNPGSQGVFSAPVDFDFYSDLSGQKFASKVLNHSLKASETSSYWFGRGMDYFSNQPGAALGNTFKKLVLFFGGNDNPQSSIMDMKFFEKNYSKVLSLPLFDFLFVSLFSIAGMLLVWKERNKFGLFYLFTGAYVLGTVLFFINGRFRLALTPMLIVFAAAGILKIFALINEKNLRLLKIPAIVIALFLITDTFIISRPVFSDYEAYSNLGVIYFDKKEYDKSIENYNKSLIYRDYYMTYVNLGNAFAAKKDYRSALGAYQKAINRKPDYALTYYNMGLVHSETGNLPLAEKTYAKALELDPDLADAYRNLGIVYYISAKYDLALSYFDKYLSLSKDEDIKASVRGDMENIRRMKKSGK